MTVTEAPACSSTIAARSGIRGAQQGPVAGRRRQQVAGAGVGDDLAPADDHQVVGGVLQFAHQVAGHQHRPACRGQRPQEAPHPHDALRVHAVERLVHHQHRRVAEQRRGDAQPLPHAQREPARPAPGHLAQPGLLDHRVDPARRPGPGSAPARAGGCVRCGWAAARRRPAGSRHGAAGTAGWRNGWPPTRAVPASGASRPRITRIVVVLPAPFGPDEPGHLPRRDGERHAVQGQRRAEALAQPAYFDRCFHKPGCRATALTPAEHGLLFRC